MEKTREIDDLQYEKLNLFKYFTNYNNFISAFEDSNQNKYQITNDNIDKFIKCLCKIYVGHNIHQRINNEISKKTNLFILKGDYFFSFGYFTVAQIGNPILIRFYSKIAENFAKSIFYIKNYISTKGITNQNSDFNFMNFLMKKYVGFIYYGCCGIKELHKAKLNTENNDSLKEFSFKYGLLLFLREELAFLKNKTHEYYVTF